MTHKPNKSLMLASLGGILEFYDFIIYALLASTLAQVFFPSGDSIISMIATFSSYAVGYLARPIGGLIFGYYGDCYGRKITFSASVLMMALATLAIGLIPDYQHAGILAPILLTLLRVIQGFSVGGEIPGAYTYISELYPQQQGLCCGILASSVTFGVVLGSVSVSLLHSLLSPMALLEWGWRLPFVLGGLLGIVSFQCRKALNESKQNQLQTNELPIVILWRDYPQQCLYGFTLISLAATTSSLLYIYIPAFLQQVVHFHNPYFMWYYSGSLVLSALANTLVGYLSDSYSRDRLTTMMCVATITLSYPCYWILINCPSYATWGLLLGSIPNALAYGMFPRIVANLFPPQVRYSGLALCYSGGFAVCGGLSPLIATYLIYITNWPAAPALFLIIMGITTLYLHIFNTGFSMRSVSVS